VESNDIDKIIQDALDEHKGGKNKNKKKGDAILKTRKILNFIFMIGFVAAIIIYFALPDNRPLFFTVGFGAMIIKVAEFFLRFMF